MFRFIVVRKLLKGWHRYYGSNNRRERGPSSLQESLEPNPPRRGLWRNWFIPLIIAPVIYYMLFVGREIRQEPSLVISKERVEIHPLLETVQKPKIEEPLKVPLDQSVKRVLDSPAKSSQTTSKPFKNIFAKAPYYQVQRPTYKDRVDLHMHPKNTKTVYSFDRRNGTITATPDANNTIQVPLPARHQKNPGTTAGPVPRKFLPICIPRLAKLKGSTLTTKRNVTELMMYQNLLYKGGLYSPGNCQPRHKVAVLVPYRNRAVNLAVFLHNIHPFLIDQALEYQIFVIEQSGDELFNKGRLYNAGFLEAQKYGDWGCIVFHDVDLLPTNMKILYTCPTWPRHMSATVLGTEEDPTYKSHFGGVTCMTLRQFRKVNGYSNLYWGWGAEDHDMFWRLKVSGLPVVRYNKEIAKYLPLPHPKEPENPVRKQLLGHATERYKKDGLTSLKYRLLSVTLYHTYTHFLVDINPEHENVTEFQMKWLAISLNG